ncbi:MAG: potassium transporter TrkH, partial [Rhodospirillales bacterium]|nr:potassium transporter TrkH [Rhodospirillales bacterium]
QIRWYLGFLIFFSGLLAFWQWAVNDMDAYESVRYATFNVVSIVTTTGFVSADYTTWGGFPQMAMFILTFIGGCTGSTAGGIKIFRFEVLFAMAGIHVKRLLHPHGVFVIDFNHRRLSDAVVRSVVGFVILYFFVFSFLSLGLTLTGVDVVTALSGATSALGNVGPGLGDIIGPAGTYKPLPDSAKWVLSLGMLMGRLELLPVIVLCLPSFWRA